MFRSSSEQGGQPRRQHLHWEDVDKIVDLLKPKIESVGVFQAMVIVTRGGIVPGGLLAEALDVKHILTAAVDFPATREAGLMTMPRFLQFPDPALLKGRRTLVVDDVWGSGRTSISVRDRLAAQDIEVYNCVFHFNPYRSLFSNIKPDFYGEATDNYIVYPWEVERGIDPIGQMDLEPELE